MLLDLPGIARRSGQGNKKEVGSRTRGQINVLEPELGVISWRPFLSFAGRVGNGRQCGRQWAAMGGNADGNGRQWAAMDVNGWQ